MPTLNRAPNEKEVQKLISAYLKVKTDIMNEIGRRRFQWIFICFWGCTVAVHSVFICNEQYYRSKTGNGDIACSHDFSVIIDDNGIYWDDDFLPETLRRFPSSGGRSGSVPDCWTHPDRFPIKNYAIQHLTPIQCLLILVTEEFFCAVCYLWSCFTIPSQCECVRLFC